MAHTFSISWNDTYISHWRVEGWYLRMFLNAISYYIYGIVTNKKVTKDKRFFIKLKNGQQDLYATIGEK
jgi:hypothetical protein